MGTYTIVAALLVTAMSNFGAGLLTIFAAVVALFVGIFLFRKGVRWVKRAGA